MICILQVTKIGNSLIACQCCISFTHSITNSESPKTCKERQPCSKANNNSNLRDISSAKLLVPLPRSAEKWKECVSDLYKTPPPTKKLIILGCPKELTYRCSSLISLILHGLLGTLKCWKTETACAIIVSKGVLLSWNITLFLVIQIP